MKTKVSKLLAGNESFHCLP